MASSFEFFQHWDWVTKIAGEEQYNVRPHLLSRDTFINEPTLGDLLMTMKLTANLAYVLTRFEAYMYNPSVAFPVAGPFDNGAVFQFGVGTNAGMVKTTNFSGLANSIANIDLVQVFQGGDNPNNQQIILQIIDPVGPKPVQMVTTAYLWRIPGGKAAKFQPYTTIFV